MSAPRIILASLPSSAKKFQNWWKFDKVLTKNFAQFFLRHGVYILAENKDLERMSRTHATACDNDLFPEIHQHIPL